MNLFTILGTLLGILVGLRLPYWLTSIVSWAEKRQTYRDIYPTQVDENKLCSGPHEWLEAPTTDGDGHYGSINVCSKCGFIPSRNMMATQTTLERIAYNKKLFAFERQLEQDFIDGENRFLDHFLKQEKIDMDGLVEVYNAGRTSNKRFVIHKLMVAERNKDANDTETQNR